MSKEQLVKMISPRRDFNSSRPQEIVRDYPYLNALVTFDSLAPARSVAM
jgi:hypothetical protein